MGAVGEGDGCAAVDGGVELGAVGEPAGVVDGVVLAGLGEGAGADDGVDVAEGVERLGGAYDLGDAGWVVGGVCGFGAAAAVVARWVVVVVVFLGVVAVWAVAAVVRVARRANEESLRVIVVSV